MTETLAICPIPELVQGGLVLGGRQLPVWLGAGFHGSDVEAEVTLLPNDLTKDPRSWRGDAGSACLRAVMITAARRGLAAIMYQLGETHATSPACMTFAYHVGLDRLTWKPGQRRRIGYTFECLPQVHRIQVLDPVEWASVDDSVSMPSDERATGLARITELMAFIEG